jgi:structure-specific endonuclease subunit SLX1
VIYSRDVYIHTEVIWATSYLLVPVSSAISSLMILVVFESNSFRWAWQNPHITQHISAESRLQHAAGKKKSGHPKRPRHSITSLLSNLHLLLRSPSFSRWPLDIRFFSEDVHKAWLKWTKSIDETLRDSIPIIQDYPPKSTVGNESRGSPQSKRRKMSHGIGALDIDYTQQKSHVEKGKDVMAFEREGECAVCHMDLEHDAGIYALCPSAGCESVTHLTCLSKHFLQGEEDSLVPIKGNCPSCKAELRWVDVIKELTLRTRGQKEVERLLKVKRARAGKTVASSESVIESSDSDELSDEDMEMEIGEEIKRLQKFNPTGRKMDMGDSWHVVDDSDSDTGSITSTTSQPLMPTSYKAKLGGLGTVIEDSDWDDAEIVD